MIHAQLVGNLVNDPNTRQAGSTTATSFTMACNTIQMENGKPKTEFVRVTVWGKRGDAVSKYRHKGDQVFAVGELYTTKYVKDGQTYVNLELGNASVEFGNTSNKNQTAVDDDELPD